MRYFLPAYFLVYFGAAFFWRSLTVWKRTGVNPLVFKGTDDAHDYVGRVFKLLCAAAALAVVVHAASERLYQYLTPICWLEHHGLRLVGVGLLLVSLAWTIAAQARMGDSWRIGIDEERRTPLVRGGLFGLSRNPIFLGMKLTLLGLFAVTPNAVTLLVLGLGVVLLHVQVRLEEEFLSRVHGEQYAEYRRLVRRWL